MKDEMNKCGCGCDEELEQETCGCCSDEHSEGCGCCSDDHDESCGCCGGHDAEEGIFVDLQDEEGNEVTCQVIDEFDYEEKTYALVQNPNNNSVYLFREEIDGEEVELINPVDDEFEKVTKYYENLE